MLRLIVISIIFSILVLFSSWAVNNSYIISIAYKEFIFSTSSSYLIALAIFILLLIFFVQSFYFKISNKFIKFNINKKLNNKEKGFDSFIQGMISLINKDFKSAVIENKKVSKYLKNSTLDLLLKSETLKIQKNYTELNLIYEKMITNEKTKLLGIRGLMEQYLKDQDYHHALIYGEKLFALSPHIEKIYDTLIYIIGRTNNWQNLIKINDRAIALRIIDKNTYSINKSIALYEIAKIKSLNELKESIHLMEKALNLRKNFPPYVSFYMDLLIENKKYNFAKKYITKVWNDSPHPEYKSQIKKLSENSGEDIYKLAKYISAKTKSEYLSKILITESLIANNQWDSARKELSELLQHRPEKEVCLLMSKIEEGDSNDKQKIDSWLSRANFGEIGSLWICSVTNISQKEWTSVSEAGHFNSLEWKRPSIIDVTANPSYKKNILNKNKNYES